MCKWIIFLGKFENEKGLCCFECLTKDTSKNENCKYCCIYNRHSCYDCKYTTVLKPTRK